MRRIGSRTCATVALLAVAGCPDKSATSLDGTVILGTWNGPHASLTVDDRGGTTEYDCAHGGLQAPIRLDADGRFVAAGVHVREHGGPIRLGEVPDSVLAVYSGRLDGAILSLRVTAGPDTLGPFTLRRDAPNQLLKCL